MGNDPFSLQLGWIMKIFIQSIFRFSFITKMALMFIFVQPSFAVDLKTFSNAKLIDNPANDGDSFHVEANGEHLHVRLYFVDCCEMSTSSKSDARRLREQTRHFGLPEPTRTIHFGGKAKFFVDSALAKPFTVHTAFASALGRSAKGRVYAFVTSFDGNDLASLLVKNGLARSFGIGRKTPGGVARDEMIERLGDLEMSAMLKRIGIWVESDPDRIADLRAKQRSEDQELKELQKLVKKSQSSKSVLNLNTASETELQSIKGIGPALAKRIAVGRPYKTVNELIKVRGIGPKTLEKLGRHLTVDVNSGRSKEGRE